MGTITYEEVEVTPQIANDWLERCNHLNRPIRWNKVTEYVDAMKGNRWRLNGQGWSFDSDGVLLDGQHRAWAVVRSGVTIRTLVIRGLSPAVRPTVDEGVKRRFSDDLAMAGVSNVNVNSALLRKIVIFTRNGGLARVSKEAVGRPEMAATWPQYAHDVVESAKAANRWYSRWPGNKGAMMFMYWLLRYHDGSNQQMVDRFFQTICIGSMADEDRILVQLRDKLGSLGSYAGERTLTRKKADQKGAEFDVYFMIRAWNTWLRGGRMDKFQLQAGGLADPFPRREIAHDLAG